MAFEIERKFIVSALPSPLPLPLETCQGYLANGRDRVVRVRIIGDGAFLTVKGVTRGTVRREYEYPIPREDAREMLDLLCLKPLIEKKRYVLEYCGVEWTIDVFGGDNLGLVLAEVELESETQAVDLPPWAGKEVTGDPRYYNANLIEAPFTTWP